MWRCRHKLVSGKKVSQNSVSILCNKIYKSFLLMSAKEHFLFYQGSGPFEEVIVDFTLEEWELLDSGQKTLCREVMWDIMKNMAALGKARLCSGFHSLGDVFFRGR